MLGPFSSLLLRKETVCGSFMSNRSKGPWINKMGSICHRRCGQSAKKCFPQAGHIRAESHRKRRKSLLTGPLETVFEIGNEKSVTLILAPCTSFIFYFAFWPCLCKTWLQS